MSITPARLEEIEVQLMNIQLELQQYVQSQNPESQKLLRYSQDELVLKISSARGWAVQMKDFMVS